MDCNILLDTVLAIMYTELPKRRKQLKTFGHFFQIYSLLLWRTVNSVFVKNNEIHKRTLQKRPTIRSRKEGHELCKLCKTDVLWKDALFTWIMLWVFPFVTRESPPAKQHPRLIPRKNSPTAAAKMENSTWRSHKAPIPLKRTLVFRSRLGDEQPFEIHRSKKRESDQRNWEWGWGLPAAALNRSELTNQARTPYPFGATTSAHCDVMCSLHGVGRSHEVGTRRLAINVFQFIRSV